MTVNGLKLPDAFVALIDRPEPIVWWVPKGGNEQWVFRGGEGGVHWAPKGDAAPHDYLDDLELIGSLATIEEETNGLPVAFHIAEYTPEEIAEWNAERANRRGFIPFITDFSQIVQFGYAGDGAAYCFDYREDPDEPSIIHWNDGYWRRVAPSFQQFNGLFEPHDLTKTRREGIEGMETARLREALREMEQRLTSAELTEARREDFENWAAVFRDELEARATQDEEPGGDRPGEG
jgi:hypothetical protein